MYGYNVTYAHITDKRGGPNKCFFFNQTLEALCIRRAFTIRVTGIYRVTHCGLNALDARIGHCDHKPTILNSRFRHDYYFGQILIGRNIADNRSRKIAIIRTRLNGNGHDIGTPVELKRPLVKILRRNLRRHAVCRIVNLCVRRSTLNRHLVRHCADKTIVASRNDRFRHLLFDKCCRYLSRPVHNHIQFILMCAATRHVPRPFQQTHTDIRNRRDRRPCFIRAPPCVGTHNRTTLPCIGRQPIVRLPNIPANRHVAFDKHRELVCCGDM